MLNGKEPETMSFEECVAELSAINRALGDRQIGIEEALTQAERGMRLSSRAADVLARAHVRVREMREAVGMEDDPVGSDVR